MVRSSTLRLNRAALVVVLLLLGAALSGCREVDRTISALPRLIAPGGRPAPQTAPELAAPHLTAPLPPRQASSTYDFEPLGPDSSGRLLYRVRIRAGGSPHIVATERLSPIFQVAGKNGPAYVAESYFQQNPGRTPTSIQPGDEFTLALPADTFVVRWREEHEQRFGHPTTVREYVSEQGDRLRYYLAAPFPVLYELQRVDNPDQSEVHFSADLPYLLQIGRTDAYRLAQLVYRIEEPDVLQVMAMQRLADQSFEGGLEPLLVDRTRRHLDPVREVLALTELREAIDAPERSHLTRAVFPEASAEVPYLAVEDALGTRTDLAQIENGRVFRILYRPAGVVEVYYKTGEEDSLGKRDPYLLRENDRWAELYQRLVPDTDTPVKWGPGEPSDLEPFPSARDPNQRRREASTAFDYLLPGRVLVLTFTPERFESDRRAEAEFRAVLGAVRDTYRQEISHLLSALASFTEHELVTRD